MFSNVKTTIGSGLNLYYTELCKLTELDLTRDKIISVIPGDWSGAESIYTLAIANNAIYLQTYGSSSIVNVEIIVVYKD